MFPKFLPVTMAHLLTDGRRKRALDGLPSKSVDLPTNLELILAQEVIKNGNAARTLVS